MRSRACLALFLCVMAAVAAPAQTEPSARELYRLGRQRQSRADYYGAVERYKEALQENPHFLEPLIGLAESYFRLEEYEEALRYVAEARTYGRARPPLENLEGRIRIALGDVDGAEALFHGVLSREPNNVDALFGLAEVAIVRGKIQSAVREFQEALRLAPENRRALLALVVLHDSQGEYEEARRYVELALRLHPNSVHVQYFAGRHFLQAGETSQAELAVRTALSLDPAHVESRLLLGRILLRTENYAEVVRLMNDLISESPESGLAWYELGLAELFRGNVSESIDALEAAWRSRPPDEIARIAMEHQIISELALEDSLRQRYAEFRFQAGRELQDRNRFDTALLEYRRGLRIHPYSRTGRLLYAELLRLMGYPARYVEELKVLESLDLADQDVLDRLEVHESLLQDTVSADWGVDQFAVDRASVAMALFHMPDTHRLDHIEAGRFLAQYFADFLLRHDHAEVALGPRHVSSFGEAFRSAREGGSDYFVTLQFRESSRIFSAGCRVYLSRTGSLVAELHETRRGPDRLRDCLADLADGLAGLLPRRGEILDRRFGQGVINLGIVDGLEAEMELPIIRRGALDLELRTVGLTYREDDVIGTFTVRRVDEYVSEGDIRKEGFFDLIGAGDQVVVPDEGESPAEPAPEVVDGGLYDLIRRIP